MKHVASVLTFVSFVSAQVKFKPLSAWGNASIENLDAQLTPRQLFERQSCEAGYGRCENSGLCCPQNSRCCGIQCMNPVNTCCYGLICPPGNGCCGTSGYCRPEGYGCCGNQGRIYPLDGSECCRDDNYCPPGSRCVSCDDGTNDVCCQGAGGNYIQPTYETDLDDVTVTNAQATTRTQVVATTRFTTSTSAYTYTRISYSWYTSIYVYFYVELYPSFTPTTTRTITTTTTLSAYVTDSADAVVSFASDTSSIQSYQRVESSLNGDFASVLSSASELLASITGTGGGGGGGSTGGASSWRADVGGLLFGVLGLMAGVLAVML